jgi:putative ABC transport system permease protein
MSMTRWLEEFRSDVRQAVRQLKAAPVFTAVAALTLALGIGANSAIFALVDAALLRPLPFADAERLVAVWERTDRSERGFASPINMLDWNERSRSFELIAGFTPSVGGMVTSGADGTSETVSRQWVSAGLFDVLGVQPIVGRTFHASDNDPQATLALLSEGYWRTRFNGDPGIVGRDIRFDGQPFTVMGVLPKEFQLLGETSMWAMRGFPRNPALRGAYAFQAVGRLKPGVTLEAARADIAAVAEGLAREFPQTNKGRTVFLEPLRDALVGRDLRLTAMLFFGVVGFVLLICCANVANLLLARATARTREMAIRSALGAGRSRALRQLLTESLVLATLGGALGVAVGAALLGVAPSIIPAGLLPGAITLTFDMRVVAFCAAAALAVGVLFGLAPAWQATGTSATQAMASEGRTATGRGGRIRGLLVVGEVATAVVLLFGAGLLLRTLLAVEGAERGYRASGVLTMLVDPLGSEYPTPQALLQFFDAVERQIRGVPGVRSVAWTSTVPFGADIFGPLSFEIVGDPPPQPSQRPVGNYQLASPAYFDALDLPLMAGRPFTDRDTVGSTPVCIVSEAFVRRYLGARSPIGQRLTLRPAAAPDAKPIVREIVGVAQQVKARPDEAEEAVQIYVPLAQNVIDDIYLVAAPERDGQAGFAASVRAAIAQVDQQQLVSVREVMTLDDVASRATGRHRFRAILVMTFAVLALLLAMVGVFGVLGYAVQQRHREFGVRQALGATPRDVLTLVLASAGRLVLTGTAIGLVLAALLARAISTFLFGVEPFDPATLAAVAVVLALTAALAVAAPAVRAARVDPVVTFRNDR